MTTRTTNPPDGFLAAMAARGMTPSVSIEPGKLVRFPGVGKSNGNKAGWAWLSSDGQAGAFGDWSSNISEDWHARSNEQMTDAERAAHRERVADLKRIRQEEARRQHTEAASEVRRIWESAEPAPPAHAYLARKLVRPHGLRISAEGRLIVPVMIDGKLTSLQSIDAEGEKRFFPGGEIQGGSYLIGEIADTVVIAEGFATAASIHEATGFPVVVAFSAGNLLAVARTIRDQYPQGQIVLAGDHDQNGVGQTKAQEAATCVEGVCIIPAHPGDWNDVFVIESLDAVRATFESVVQNDPEPIPLDAVDAPTFPLELIGALWLRDMIHASVRATEVPVDLPLLLGLGVIAACVQGKYVVQPEPGYTEPLNVWMIPALESGNRKTTVLRDMTSPLLAFEHDHAAAQAEEIARAEANRRLAEDRVKHLRQRAARAEGTEFEQLRTELVDAEISLPSVPTPLRIWAQDVTVEKLGQLMADNGDKMAILSDEGGPFDILAGRYSNGAPNLDLFLQAYSGAAYRVDRGSRSPVFLHQPALTLVLSPQPSVLRGLAAVPGFRGRGLLARPLYALPQSTLGFRTLTPQAIPHPVREAYGVGCRALLMLSPRADAQPHAILFSDDAYTEWKSFQRHVEVELRDGGTFEHIRDWAAKLPGNVARIAGLLHCAEHAHAHPELAPVSQPTMEAALALGGIFERHALAVFSLMSVDSTLDAARKVWAWIERGRHTTFSRRDCHHQLQGTFPTLDSLLPALSVLIERGYLFPVQADKRVGRPSHRFRVNRQLTEGWT